MGRTVATIGVAVAIALGQATAWGDPLSERAEALWAAREDPAKAREAVKAWGEILDAKPNDYEALVRLSRLHYWIGLTLEEKAEGEALDEFRKGEEAGARAMAANPGKPGGYFFKAANLARWASLKGRVTSALRAGDVRSLNEKAEAIQRDYFYAGPDRFFCAYYTRLPGLLGGDVKKAIARGKSAVEAHPDYAGNRVYLGEAYFKDGKNDLARREFEAALAIPDAALPDAVPEQRMEKRRASSLLKKIGK